MSLTIRTPSQIASRMSDVLKALVSASVDLNPGSVFRSLIEAPALQIAEVYMQLAKVYEASFINTATGQDLDLRLADFGLSRLPAQPSSGFAVIYDSSIFQGVTTIAIPSGTTRLSAMPAASLNGTTGGILISGQVYYYKMTAINALGETAAGLESAGAPGGSNTAITVSWTAVTGASGYKIYRATSSGAEVLIATISSGAVVAYLDLGGQIGGPTPPVTNTTNAIPVINAGTATWPQTGGFVIDAFGPNPETDLQISATAISGGAGTISFNGTVSAFRAAGVEIALMKFVGAVSAPSSALPIGSNVINVNNSLEVTPFIDQGTTSSQGIQGNYWPFTGTLILERKVSGRREQFPYSLFGGQMVLAYNSGQTSVSVGNLVGGITAWPSTGTIVVDYGTDSAETLTYTAATPGVSQVVLTLSGGGLTKNHLINAPVTLVFTGGAGPVYLTSGTTAFTHGDQAEIAVSSRGTDYTLASGLLAYVAETAVQARINFQTTQTVILYDGDYAVKNVPISSSNTGPDNNTGPNTITNVSASPFTGASITNPTRIQGGALIEADSAARQRLRNYIFSLARATAGAVVAGLIGLVAPADIPPQDSVLSSVNANNPSIGKKCVNAQYFDSASIPGQGTLFIDDGSVSGLPIFEGLMLVVNPEVALGPATAKNGMRRFTLAHFPLLINGVGASFYTQNPQTIANGMRGAGPSPIGTLIGTPSTIKVWTGPGSSGVNATVSSSTFTDPAVDWSVPIPNLLTNPTWYVLIDSAKRVYRISSYNHVSGQFTLQASNPDGPNPATVAPMAGAYAVVGATNAAMSISPLVEGTDYIVNYTTGDVELSAAKTLVGDYSAVLIWNGGVGTNNYGWLAGLTGTCQQALNGATPYTATPGIKAAGAQIQTNTALIAQLTYGLAFTVLPGFVKSDLISQVKAAVEAYVNNLPPNSTISNTQLCSAAAQISGVEDVYTVSQGIIGSNNSIYGGSIVTFDSVTKNAIIAQGYVPKLADSNLSVF